MKNDSALFYTCSLIEFIGRKQHLKRSCVVKGMGKDSLKQIYDYADVFHCEPIAKTADEFIKICSLPKGNFDNVGNCQYTVPDYWTIGEVYERLVEDICTDNPIDTLVEIYSSWIDSAISDYNTDFFYQPRDYISECYKCNEVL